MQNLAFIQSITNKDYKVQLGDYFNIGSNPDCHLHLNLPNISERHSRIEKRNENYIIKDLRSAGGTYVNDTLILEAILNDGDIIRVGDIELHYGTSESKNCKFSVSSKNQVWQQELEAIANAAKSPHPILLLGPSGAGKDVLAKSIHQASKRVYAPLLSVNCSALTETLVESELFGHIKGSFTGAIADRKGAFEAARGGTLFLDEIGDLSYPLQAKILRAIENNEIRPVGSDRIIKTDVRIIAATHQNLSEKIIEGKFRSDLFYRLNVVTISVPALNCRMEDFEDLLYTFAKELRVRFSFNAIEKIKKYKWPGNIRELRNFVARASALYPGERISEDHVDKLIPPTQNDLQETNENFQTLPVMKEIEKQMIIKRLQANRGNQRRTATDLGLPKSTLHDRLKYYNIDAQKFKL